jgi:NAD+ kinase
VNGENLLKSVGLVARYDKPESLKLAKNLAQHLRAKGLTVYAEDTLKDKIDTEAKLTPLTQMKTDFIITIGGDGTILRACLALPNPQPPILAVNMSVRGFLTAVEPKHAFDAVDKCLDGEFRIEKCTKLSTTAKGPKFPDALNEVLILADEPAKLIRASIRKDKVLVLDCQADGLIISTQTGSTGYSLSSGGPVLDPNVNAFVLTAICPLTAFHPLVFPADSMITVEVDKPKKLLVIVDGHHQQVVSSEPPKLSITRSKHEASFIRFGEDFYYRLRSRLLFKGIG